MTVTMTPEAPPAEPTSDAAIMGDVLARAVTTQKADAALTAVNVLDRIAAEVGNAVPYVVLVVKGVTYSVYHRAPERWTVCQNVGGPALVRDVSLVAAVLKLRAAARAE